MAGYVRNLPDGRVELLVEGDPAEIEALLQAVQNEVGEFIREMTSDREQPDDPPLVGFSVLF